MRFPPLLVLLALVAAQARAHEGGRALLAEADARVAAAPASAEARFARAELHRAGRRFAFAERDYRACLALDGEFAAAHLGLSALHLEAGRPRRALAEIERFLALMPRAVEGLRLRARILTRLREGTRARAAWNALLDRIEASGGAEPEDYLDAARAARGVDERLALLERGIDRCGPAITLELAALETEERAGRVRAALARLDGIIARDPAPARWSERRKALLARLDP